MLGLLLFEISSNLWFSLEILYSIFLSFFSTNSETDISCVPIFFISVGASFEIEAIFQEGLVVKALLITLAMIFIRLIASTLFIKDIGLNKFFMLGLSHSMPLTLLIAVTTLAYNNHSITQEYYYAFILAAILEVLIVMIAIRILSNYINLNNRN